MQSFAKENRAFKELRLEIASAILRNSVHVSNALKDIDAAEHVLELCDEYTMRRMIVWLATKYGYSRLLPAIQKEKSKSENQVANNIGTVERFFLSTEIYPFSNVIELKDERDLIDRADRLFESLFEPSVELLGSLYEHSSSYEIDLNDVDALDMRNDTQLKYGRRKKGQFYTAAAVVDYCLEKSLVPDLPQFMRNLQQLSRMQNGHIDGSNGGAIAKGERNDIFSIIDPSCGSGNFLIGVLRLLLKNGAGPAELLQCARHSLHGRDVDGKATAIAIFSVLLTLSKLLENDDTTFDTTEIIKTLRRNICASDSVYESFATKTLENGSISRFNLVITNPPYISYGSRNQEKILESTAKFLKTNFQLSAEYKIRLNAIFQEVALNFAKADGRICLLVPNGFLTGKGYSKLRAGLLTRARITSLSELPDDTIKGAVVGRWCVAAYQLGSTDENYDVELVDLCAGEAGRSQPPVPVKYELPVSQLVSPDENRFRLVFNNMDRELALRFDNLPPLKSALRGHTGIRSRIGQNAIVSDRHVDERFKKGIKSGGQVSPFSVRWDGSWLQIEPSKLFRGGFDERVVENPKIMVRQTGDRIVAACDDSALYHLNNVHSFSPQLVNGSKTKFKPTSADLHFYCSLMNSRLWLYIYRLKTREDGRVLAQIDIETVETMPLPNLQAESETTQMISSLSSMLCRAGAMRRPAPLETGRISRIIDRLIYSIYDLSQNEVAHVDRIVHGTGDSLPELSEAWELAHSMILSQESAID